MLALILLGVIAVSLMGIVYFLWYINENIARIVNELSWFGKWIEQREKNGKL